MQKQKVLGHLVSRSGISRSPELMEKYASLFKQLIGGPEDLERNLALFDISQKSSHP